MRFGVVLLVLVLSIPAPATAGDWAEGLEAYDGGDYVRAVTLWRRAADAGNLDAMTAIADAHARGLGVAPDLAAAVAWYRRAAERGHTVAQLNLGDMISRGAGAEPDLVEAYVWLGLAAADGNAWAARRQGEVRAAMTDEARAAAERRLRAWRPLTD